MDALLVGFLLPFHLHLSHNFLTVATEGVPKLLLIDRFLCVWLMGFAGVPYGQAFGPASMLGAQVEEARTGLVLPAGHRQKLAFRYAQLQSCDILI